MRKHVQCVIGSAPRWAKVVSLQLLNPELLCKNRQTETLATMRVSHEVKNHHSTELITQPPAQCSNALLIQFFDGKQQRRLQVDVIRLRTVIDR